MDVKSEGAWHIVYGGLVAVFCLLFLVFDGAVSSASTPAMERGWMAAVIALALVPVTILFWILAAVNAAAIRRYYGQRFQTLQSDHQAELESLGEQEQTWRRKAVELLYELASEFSTRFAGHYVRTVVEHPEKEGNRRDFWVVVAFISAMINEMGALGDTRRAELLGGEFSRLFLDRRTAFPDAYGEGRRLLEEAKLVLGVLPSARTVSTEYLAVARSTRLLDYVVDFKDSASS